MYFINSSIFGVQISQTHFVLLICYESANQNIEPQCIPTPAKIEHERVLLHCHALFLEMRHLYFFPISMVATIIVRSFKSVRDQLVPCTLDGISWTRERGNVIRCQPR